MDLAQSFAVRVFKELKTQATTYAEATLLQRRKLEQTGLNVRHLNKNLNPLRSLTQTVCLHVHGSCNRFRI
jgi:hypothetical protein